MKRKIIRIDEEKCNGCGQCIPNCPEGAIQIIDDKARLISDLFCDGLGACIGHCPQGAITIEEREAKAYDESKTIENIVKGGPNVIKAHLKHLRDHGETDLREQAMTYLKKKKIFLPQEAEKAQAHAQHAGSGCPGMKIMDFRNDSRQETHAGDSLPGVVSELRQWPIQLHLLHPQAPYFKNADLVIAADCVAFAFADFHRRFLKGKTLIILCPKLDDAYEEYVEKLTEIFKISSIKSITTVHMEVTCCFGVGQIVKEALKSSEKKIAIRDHTISLKGELL